MSYNPNFSGVSSASASLTTRTSEANNTGGTIAKLFPVRINASGDMALIDIGIESQALSIAGVTDGDVNDGSLGNIVVSGKIKNITTTAALGDVLYISKMGGTTNIKPTIGVAGFVADDFVVRLGIISRNADSPSNKDLLVNISIVGQL